MQRNDVVYQPSAADLNTMEFPALRKNPFLKKKPNSSPVLNESEVKEIEAKLTMSPKIPISYLKSVIKLTPTGYQGKINTTGKSGVTTCFTAETIEKMMEENQSFAYNTVEYNNSRSRNSAQDGKGLDTLLDGCKSRLEKSIYNQLHSRQSSISKNKSHKSKDRSISKSGREGSGLRSNITGASPKRSPLKVYHDFMKDI